MFWLLGNASVKLYPRILGYGIGIVTTAIVAHHYMKIQTKAQEVSVYENMEKGSKPPLPKKKLMPREDIAEEVKRFFFPDYKVGDRETDEPEVFSEKLANSSDEDTSLEYYLVLGYFSSDYFMYYRLAEKQEVAIRTTFEVFRGKGSETIQT